MIFSGLQASEMPISIVSVSFGDVDVPYLNCPCMTIRYITYHPLHITPFQELHLVAGNTRRALGEMQSLFNVSFFSRDSALHPDPIPEGCSQFHILLLSRVLQSPCSS